MEILQLKSNITNEKLKGLNSRFELVEERIHELANTLIEIHKRERGKMKKIEKSFREMSVTIKYTIVHIMEVPKRRKEKKEQKSIQIHNG